MQPRRCQPGGQTGILQTCQVSHIWRETHAFWPQITSHARKGDRDQMSHSFHSTSHISASTRPTRKNSTGKPFLDFIFCIVWEACLKSPFDTMPFWSGALLPCREGPATAARPICAKKHRLAMYQRAVTMFYLPITIIQQHLIISPSRLGFTCWVPESCLPHP